MKEKQKQNSRNTERLWFLLVTIVLGLTFLKLHYNYRKQFEPINESYANQTTVNLDKDFDPQLLANLLVEGDYISDEESAILIANHIQKKLADGVPLPNLGELNKPSFKISADTIDLKGGESLKKRIEEHRKQLGITNSLPETAENTIDLKQGNCEIKVIVQELNENANIIFKKLNLNKRPLHQVLVQITEHFYDSLSMPQENILDYAMTNENGVAVFIGLNADRYYSVLPIKQGCEYGTPKGTTKGNLGSTKNKTFTFTQRELKISPFDNLSSLKEDHVITARTPQEFQGKFVSNFIFILLAWWGLHIYLTIRKKTGDQIILPLIMLLSGFSLLILYSIHNPLTDKMLGNATATGILFGIVSIALFSEINIVTLFNDNYKFLGKWGGLRPIYFDWVHKIFPRLPQGSGYLILALVLTFLLFPFGTSPQAGVKVTLFFFQPSEIAKYLIIIFLAAYFYHKAKIIQTFSQINSKDAWKIQWSTVLKVALSLGALLMLYFVLSDGGPALVIAGTFILLYSFIRQDLPQLLLGIVTFAVFLLVAKWFVHGNSLVMFAFALAWFLLWLVYGFKIYKKPQIFESAIFFNLIIAAFIFVGDIPGFGERFQARNEMCINTWDNEVVGGEQVAQGLWGLASGGVFGQGLGKGNPNFVPAAHTDMIFTSMGEQIGFVGLALIIVCLAMLLWRSLLAGKKSGHPFTLYLAVGIAIVTGVQFLIITLGSVGLIPLTGIAAPFLSYGNVSLIMNMFAFGIVFSISNLKAGEYQQQEMNKNELKLMLNTCKFGYAALALVLLGTLFYYQVFWITQNKTLISPVLTCNSQSARIVKYNPRIQLLMKKMNAGNIYDRNGILLATNDKEQIRNTLNTYIEAGVAEDIYKNELKKRKQRYYPFGENLFFWLGDFNHTNILWNDSENDPRGYIAECRHLAHLRGFNNLRYDPNNKIQQFDLKASKEKATFLYPIEKQYKHANYDYSFLIPYLKAGIHSEKVKNFNKEKKREERDIMLTVDAKLQTQLQNEINNYVSNPQLFGLEKNYFKGERWNKLRISVVVLDAANGDLLCSANYPLPNMQTLKEKQRYAYSEKDSREKAYTDRDLGLTYQTPPGSTAKVMSALAGFQKMGTAAARKTYYIDAQEVVHVGIEPCNHYVTMEEAIVKSSNNYFINLVNDQKLYKNLDSIYQTVGIRIDRKYTKTEKENNALTPYFFVQTINSAQKMKYTNEVNAVQNSGIRRYERYIEKHKENPQYFDQMNWFETAWAWGQGSMSATPLNMAKIAAIVANGGEFVETQFVKKGNPAFVVKNPQITRIVSLNEANILKSYMQNESSARRGTNCAFPVGMGGKSGTPERGTSNKNDGWYIFFINAKIPEYNKEKKTIEKKNVPIAVAIRMERLGAGISTNAVQLADKVVINKVLRELGYVE